MKLTMRNWIHILCVVWVAPTIASSQEGTIYFVGGDEESVYSIDVEKRDVRYVAAGEIDGRFGDGIAIRQPDGTMLATSTGGQITSPGFDPRNRDLNWSPDGSMVVYRRSGSLHTASADGSGEKLLVQGARRGLWSPTEPGVIYFNRLKDGHSFTYDILRIDTAAPKEEIVADSHDMAGRAPFSPDGSKMLVTGCDDGGYCISYMDLETGAIRDFGSPMVQNADWPMWSPDSQSILFSRDQGMQGLYTLDVATGATRRLVSGSGTAAAAGGVWSPEGDYVAFHFEDFGVGTSPRLSIVSTERNMPPEELGVGRWATWTAQSAPPGRIIESGWGAAKLGAH